MDIPRSRTVVRNKKIRRAIYLVLVLAAVGGVSVFLSKLRPQAPPLERATQIIDTVKQDEFVVKVRGLGTLKPADGSIVYIPALTPGRVEKRHVFVGQAVKPDTVIVSLVSPEAEQALQDAELKLRQAENDYTNKRVELQANLLTLESGVSTIEADHSNAELEARYYEELGGLVPKLDTQKRRTNADELANRLELEKKRLKINADVMQTQLAVAKSLLDQARAMFDLRKQQVDNLQVKAGMTGLVLELTVLEGQPVTAGQSLARVSDPKRLKAEIKIPETQARDIQYGQYAEIDTRTGAPMIKGHVSRIDPASVEGTRTIDVRLETELPPGSVPDMSVEGEVEITRMPNVLQVQRPAFGQENSSTRMFRLTPDGNYADAVTVKFGRTSVTQIQILSGLKVGDKVIVSDTSSQVPDNADRV
ncbi:MAG: efflux RND transporter periplasmic adaptor subunit, partial [Blastocatellia bacterium]|nr:efflux RND transporter periplasmic adaptor subunit [Blastocatellia bacterium]